MSTLHLPEDPSLERLRKEARRLQRSARAGDPTALELIAGHHPDGAPGDPSALPLSAAQLVIARRYGFASWPALRRHLEVVQRYSWRPASEPGSARAVDPADRLCRLACLTYADDGPERWAAARELLAADPSLPRCDVWAAAAAGSPRSVRDHLARDRSLAVTGGGPYRWSPLFYLAYSRLDPAVDREDVLAIAQALLEAGADPNEGYLWRGLPTPFTLLTGAFGHGELGPERQPPHPHGLALARLLLQAGADPNDGQALYNRMFEADDDHLELLFAHGLGRGDGGPWRARLGDQLDSPAQMVAGQLWWAVGHDQLDRVRLLAAHGADLTACDDDGHTPADVAALNGSAELVAVLDELGAPAPALTGIDGLHAALMAADAPAVRAQGASMIAALRRQRPWLIVWAAARGRAGAVQLMIEHGFDVNAYGRGDIPSGMAWETALHQAAMSGDVALIELLLAAGADTGLRDHRFDGTPLQWARYGGQSHAAAVLEARE